MRCGRFSPAWTPKHYAAQAARVDALAEITGMPTDMVPRERQREALGSDFYHGGMVVAATGSLHPGKYARGLAAAAEKAGAALVDGVRVGGIRREGAGRGWRPTAASCAPMRCWWRPTAIRCTRAAPRCPGWRDA